MIQKLKKLIGHKYDTRYTWGELNFHKFNLRGSWLGCGLSTDNVSGGKMLGFHLPFMDLYIHLNHGEIEFFDDERYRKYNLGFYDYCSIVFGWGEYRKTIRLPWSLDWESTEVLDTISFESLFKDSRKNGTDHDALTKAEERHSKQEPYTYTLKNGQIQNVIATYHLDRMTWHWRGLPFIKNRSTTIRVDFDQEVGEGTGSWKGGTIGCGYKLLPNETALQCLKRMELERKFNR